MNPKKNPTIFVQSNTWSWTIATFYGIEKHFCSCLKSPTISTLVRHDFASLQNAYMQWVWNLNKDRKKWCLQIEFILGIKNHSSTFMEKSLMSGTWSNPIKLVGDWIMYGLCLFPHKSQRKISCYSDYLFFFQLENVQLKVYTEKDTEKCKKKFLERFC